MAKLPDTIWNGLRKRMASIAWTFTGKHVGIEEIPRASGELGFTSRGGAIWLSRDNDILDKIPTETESTAFVYGVFAHELMHQLITDFCEFEKTLTTLNPSTAEIFKIIYNVMEDPAIEEQAKYYIGGDLLSSLHYTVMTTYKQTKPLGKGRPMTQLINALIMYGDGGFVKGRFRSAKARRMFQKILPIVDRTIEEPDGRKRVRYAYEVFLITKPLWEDDAKLNEELRKLMEELRKNMSGNGKSMSGSSDQSPVNPDRNEGASDPAMDKKKNRRKVTYRKVSKEELEELKKSGAAGKDDGVSDIEILYCDDEGKSGDAGEQPGKPSSAAQERSDDNSDGEEGTGASAQKSEDKAVPDREKPQASSDSKPSADSSAGENDGSVPGDGGMYSGDEGPDFSKEETIDELEYELSAEDIARVNEMIREIIEGETSARTERDACYAENLDVPAMKSNYAGARCLNNRVRKDGSRALESAYNKIITLFSANINRLTNQMKRIINNDRGERLYRSCGKVHVPRLCGGRMTTNVFRRNIDPANKADMCVLFLVDESGSMSGNKSKCAMECAVCLAEVLARLHIPLKVIGFTADIGGYDVVHNHYMHWLNTYEERLNLTSITSRCNNFDGYSIRYATEMLRKRPEEHKLLIVLSDGQPAARYYTRGSGIPDTTDAIKCAKKKVDVIGVGVGSSGEKVWRAMYGNSFLHVKNADDLLQQIGSEIQKIMKRW